MAKHNKYFVVAASSGGRRRPRNLTIYSWHATLKAARAAAEKALLRHGREGYRYEVYGRSTQTKVKRRKKRKR